MVVRDDQGNILNPELTSTVTLYRHHHLAKERILKATVSYLIFIFKTLNKFNVLNSIV